MLPWCRDLKPENFLLADQSDRAELKATDFGLSAFFRPGQVFSEILGSAYYIAPEVCLNFIEQLAPLTLKLWFVGRLTPNAPPHSNSASVPPKTYVDVL